MAHEPGDADERLTKFYEILLECQFALLLYIQALILQCFAVKHFHHWFVADVACVDTYVLVTG